MIWESAGLTVEFVYEREPELIVGRPDGIAASDLFHSTVSMLARHDIPGIVPLYAELVDGSVKLHYRIAGLRSLRSALKTGMPQHRHWEGLLTALVLAMERGREHLMHEADFVLHPDWIWVGPNPGQVSLMAVPLRSFAQAADLLAQWEALYTSMARHGLPVRFAELLQPEQWKFGPFSHRLWIRRWQSRDEASQTGEENGLRIAAETTGGSRTEDHTAYRETEIVGKAIATAADGSAVRWETRSVSVKEAAGLLLCLGGWIGFALEPSTIWIMLASAGSLPLGAALRKRYGGKAARPATQTSSRSVSAANTGKLAASQQPLEHRTTMLPHASLRHASETAKLSDWRNQSAMAVFLDIQYDGGRRQQTVALSALPFRIGRGPGVGFVLDDAAISRVHVEFRQAGDEIQIGDVGSTNGTILNSKALPPRTFCPLQAGDVIRLPGVSISFRCEGLPAAREHA